MNLQPLLCACAVAALAGCAGGASTTQAGAEPVCEQPTPALGSVVVRRDRCIITTEEDRLNAQRRAREIREEQNRGRDSARVSGMGGG